MNSNTLNFTAIICFAWLFFGCTDKPTDNTPATTNQNTIATATAADTASLFYGYQKLPFGAIKPQGWIRQQLITDLDSGYYPHFKAITHTLAYDLFLKQNRHSQKMYDNMKSWWSGEHEGYWKDGMYRMAFLVGHDSLLAVTQQWLTQINNKADSTGYLGIYARCADTTCRFNHTAGNGELWTQSRIMMPLLAMYETTKDTTFLKTVEQSVKLTMDAYSGRNPFSSRVPEGGVSHGVGFIEVLEWLYRLTDNDIYLQYTDQLYADFSTAKNMRDPDLQLDSIINNQVWEGHSPHIAEGFLMPFVVGKHRNDATGQLLMQKTAKMLQQHSTPSGALLGDERVGYRLGSANQHYEYCCMAELINPANVAFTISKNFALANQVEKLVYNAGQGGRLPVLTGLSYLTTDNRPEIDEHKHVERFSYDVNHKAASCCALNGGRLMPYFVESMYMRNNATGGLIVLYYGPSQVNTTVANVPISITQNTHYPFNDKVELVVAPQNPVNFKLELRQPHNCSAIKLALPEGIKRTDTKNTVILSGDWPAEPTKIKINFEFKPQLITDQDTAKSKYLQRGPLVYAVPIQAATKNLEKRGNTAFFRLQIDQKPNQTTSYKWPNAPSFVFKADQATPNWANAGTAIQTKMVDSQNNLVDVTLIPLGMTLLRQVSFAAE